MGVRGVDVTQKYDFPDGPTRVNIELRNPMPLQTVSRSVWERFWLPKWVPNRGPEGVQIRLLMYISLRWSKRGFSQVFFLVLSTLR